MPPTIRLKSCLGCTKLKRRCDKQLPECQRCINRDVDCEYPQRKRRRREGSSHEIPQIENSDQVDSQLLNLPDLPDLPNELPWDAPNLDDILVPGDEEFLPAGPNPQTHHDGLPDSSITPAQGALIHQTIPFFLRSETWTKQYGSTEPICMTFAELKPLVDAVKQMLHAWATKGHNSFIHPQLYTRGLPTCLQDAFTALCAYEARAPTVSDTILQIAQDRSAGLAAHTMPLAIDRDGIREQLAHVQALFILLFIQLWDGAISPRAHAERLIPTLRLWMTVLWQTVKEYRAHDLALSVDATDGSRCEFSKDFTTQSNLWHLWIVTESIRRTDILVTTVINTYEIMTKGWAECSGTDMFTARAGLWQAESALDWCELVDKKSPLLVPSFEPKQLMEQCNAEECDDFVKLFWGFIVGKERVEWWRKKGPVSTEAIMAA